MRPPGRVRSQSVCSPRGRTFDRRGFDAATRATFGQRWTFLDAVLRRHEAARAVPLGGAVVIAAVLSISNGAWIVLLAVAGVCQVGDAVIGLWRRIPGQVAGSVLVGTIHLASMTHLLATK
ncbi:hypothetical protein NG2371_05204 [Nocardia gamkensis]|nr:hypothetical protein [Nocardia gamkensis]